MSVIRGDDSIQSTIPSGIPEEGKGGANFSRAVSIKEVQGTITVEGNDYIWEWRKAGDDLRLLDKQGLLIVTGKAQPAVVVQTTGEKDHPRCISGKFAV